MRGARPEADLERRLERAGVIRRGEHILVACSGGPDSVALLAALHAIAVPLELSLTLAYVHHGTRDSAWQDECVVLGLGATFGLPVRVAAVRPSDTGEAALRERRYAVLAELAAGSGCGAVATGHHAEDQSESVLLALFRGTGPDGLAGMRPRRPLAPGVELLRPLLRVSSRELRQYCHVHSLAYAVDPTNTDTSLRRNAVREALESLRPLFPGLDASVARAAELIGEEIHSGPRAGLRKQVRMALREQEGLRNVDFDHIEAAVRALELGGSGRFIMKPGLWLDIERGNISVIRKEA